MEAEKPEAEKRDEELIQKTTDSLDAENNNADANPRPDMPGRIETIHMPDTGPAPTDTNPNPGNEPLVVETQIPGQDFDEGPVEIEGVADNVHLGDGRVVYQGGHAKVSKDLAKQLIASGQVKKV